MLKSIVILVMSLGMFAFKFSDFFLNWSEMFLMH